MQTKTFSTKIFCLSGCLIPYNTSFTWKTINQVFDSAHTHSNTPRTNVAGSGLTSAKTRNFHSSIYYKMLICRFPSSPLSSSLRPTPSPLRLICVSFISVSKLMNCNGSSRENAYNNKALGMAEARIRFAK